MIDSTLITSSLLQVKQETYRMKEKHGPDFINTAEFSAWEDKVIKWLAAGHFYTTSEQRSFRSIPFRSLTSAHRMALDDWERPAQEDYIKYCNRTISILESAIENIQIGLITEDAGANPKKIKGENANSGRYNTNISRADTIVLGDGNIINRINSITVTDFLNTLEREMSLEDTSSKEIKGIFQRLRELSKNSSFASVLGQTVGQFIRTFLT
jgi:hypothetical protein